MCLTADASLEVVIPQRFGRPAGYAFVALKTEDDAKKVLEALADEGESCYGLSDYTSWTPSTRVSWTSGNLVIALN